MENSIFSPLLSFFYKVKISRKRNKKEIQKMFQSSYEYNKELTIKLLYYIGDTNGLNERYVSIACFKWLIENDKETFLSILPKLIQYNREDFLLHILNTSIEQDILQQIKTNIQDDLETLKGGQGRVSNFSKQLPNINSKNQQKREIAKKIANFMGWTPIEYRKNIGLLKKNIAKSRNDKVSDEKQETYTNTLLNEIESNMDISLDKKTMEILYQKSSNESFAFPYDFNFIPIVNTSFSMFCNTTKQPYCSVFKIATYFAYSSLIKDDEFNGLYFDFDDEAKLNKLDKTSLDDFLSVLEMKISCLDLEKVYGNLLEKLLEMKYPTEKQLPNILIFTNSDFDSDIINSFFQEMIYDKMFLKYQENGYRIPNVVFWNIDSNEEKQEILSNRKGVILLSGFREEYIEFLKNETYKNPFQLLLDKLSEYDD